MPYRKTDHPGVTVSRNRHGKLYARWLDPDTLKVVSEAFSKRGFTTKTRAAEWLRKKSAELREAKQRASIAGPRANIGSFWVEIEAAYLEYFEAEHGKDAATRTKRDWLRRWREHLAKQHVRTGGDLNPNHLMNFRLSLANGEGLAPSSRNRTLGTIRAYLKWAIDADYVRINSDHLRKHLKPFKVPRTQPKVLNRAELKRLLKALVKHDSERHFASRENKSAYSSGKEAPPTGAKVYQPLAPFALLALLTGARPGEVLSLKWSDVDFESGEVHVWGSKTKRERVVPLHDSPALRELLTALKLRSAGAVHLCGDWDKSAPIQIHDRQWRRLAKLAALEGVPMKALRSTCVAHVASASPDSEYLLEARFGHGANVSKKHYRKPLHGLSKRGDTVEEWLGIQKELQDALPALGLSAAQVRKVD